MTTRRDPEGRPTVYELIAGAGAGSAPMGRLDLATQRAAAVTNDTQLGGVADRPRPRRRARVYLVTVRGRVTAAEAARLTAGVTQRRRAAGRVGGADSQGVGP